MAKLSDRGAIPTQIPDGVARPLYAGVGVTDRVVEVVRGAVADVQKRAAAVQQTVSGLDYQPQALAEQATQAFTTRLDEFGKDAQARRLVIEQRVAELQADAKNLPARLQKRVEEQVALAATTYDELVKRGETLVGRIRRQSSTQAAASSAQTTVAKAKTTRTQAKKTGSTARRTASSQTRKTAQKTAQQARQSPARSSAKATATSAKKTASQAARAVSDAAQKVGD